MNIFALPAIIRSFIARRRANGTRSAPRKPESSADLTVRNDDLIRKHFELITASKKSYYIQNAVIDCIREIAAREGRRDLAPRRREWLSDWQSRSDVPADYKALTDHIIGVFHARFTDLVVAARRSDSDRLDSEPARLMRTNEDLIAEFLRVTERKIMTLDAYGDENWAVLPEEIRACVNKIAQREGLKLAWDAYAPESRRQNDSDLERHSLRNTNYCARCLRSVFCNFTLRSRKVRMVIAIPAQLMREWPLNNG